jgi:hypothetical protein
VPWARPSCIRLANVPHCPPGSDDSDIVRPKFLDYTAAGAKVRQGMIATDGHPARTPTQAADCHRSQIVVHEGSQPRPEQPRLLDHVRASLRSRHHSGRTDEAYVHELDGPWLDGLVRAKRPECLPVVLTRDEVVR